MERKQLAAISCRAFLMTILYLNPLLLLSACTAGDIGSSASSSNASVDQSDDHSITGDTNCSVQCTELRDGEDVIEAEYIKLCNGAQVSSGSFTDGTTCKQVSEKEDAPLVVSAPSDSQEVLEDEPQGTVNQSGAI